MSYRRDRSLPAALLAMCIAGPACADCPVSGEETVRVSAVETRLELRLEDGRLIRLIGLDPASQTPSDPDRADAARATLAAQLAGHTITLHRVSATPDRWGRIAAMAFATGDTSARETGDIALTAIAKGLGRYHADARRPAPAAMGSWPRKEEPVTADLVSGPIRIMPFWRSTTLRISTRSRAPRFWL